MKFPYVPLPVAKGGAGEPEPILRAVVVGPKGRAAVWAVVDSGSTETMLPAEASDLAGVAVTAEERPLAGIGGGTVTCRIAMARIELARGRISFVGRVCAFPAGTKQLAVLGRRDLFMRHYLSFAARDGFFWINDYRD